MVSLCFHPPRRFIISQGAIDSKELHVIELRTRRHVISDLSPDSSTSTISLLIISFIFLSSLCPISYCPLYLSSFYLSNEPDQPRSSSLHTQREGTAHLVHAQFSLFFPDLPTLVGQAIDSFSVTTFFLLQHQRDDSLMQYINEILEILCNRGDPNYHIT